MENRSIKSTRKNQELARVATPSGSRYLSEKVSKTACFTPSGTGGFSTEFQEDSPAKSHFKYVISDVDKNGNRRWYVRRPKHRKVRMPCSPNEPEFRGAYDQCFAGTMGPNPRFKKRRPNMFNIGEAIEYGLKKARHRAKALGREFDLTIDWCFQQLEGYNCRCAVSGVPFFMEPKGKSKCHPYAPSIDRIDCSRGYTQDNCRIVLFAVNVMLFDWGEDVLRTVAMYYHKKEFGT